MIKISKFSQSELISFFQSYKESSLRIKINVIRGQDISYLNIFEEYLSKLIHLQDLKIIVPSNVLLTEDGYLCITNAIKNLNQLVKLSIIIGEQCYLSDTEFTLLTTTILNLKHIQVLSLTINSENNIRSQVCQDFVDSLRQLLNLRNLSLHFLGHQKSSGNEGNVQFWRGIQYLSNLKKLKLGINFHIFGEDDLRDLYAYVSSFKELTHFAIIPFTDTLSPQHLDVLIPYLGQMIQLRSLKMEDIELNKSQLLKLIKNLSNLQSIEKLKMQRILNQLVNYNYEDYLTLIGKLTNLKKLSFIPTQNSKAPKQDIVLMSKTVMQLNNLQSLEINFSNLAVTPSDEFINNIVYSFKQLSNSILILNLNQVVNMSLYGCNKLGESFCYLKNLIKLEMNYKSANKHDTSLIFNIRNLINLKYLSFQTSNDKLQEKQLYESIQYLKQLENLYLERDAHQIQNDSPTNFKSLICTLKQLKKLKDIHLNIKIANQGVKQWEQFINAFEELHTLERLHLDLDINSISYVSEGYQLLKYMNRLKKLKISLTNFPINLFYQSSLIQINPYKQLEDVDLYFEKQIQNQFFVYIMDQLATSFSGLKRLKLRTELSYDTLSSQEFGVACSKFANLEKLRVNESQKGSICFYAKGIVNMKKLKSLKFYCTSCSFIEEEEDASELVKSVMNLSDLEKLVIRFSSTEKISQTFETELNILMNTLKKLRYVSIDISNYREDQWSKQLSIVNSISLEKQQTNKLINDTLDETKAIDHSQENAEKQTNTITNTAYQNNKAQLQPSALVLSLIQNNDNDDAQQFFILNQLEDINLSYLSYLEIYQKNIFANEAIVLNVDLFSRMDQLKNLRSLYLNLKQFQFTEDQIISFASNLKSFVYLDSFDLKIKTAQDYDDQLFQEIKELTHLSSLFLEMGIPETCAIPLGNSLVALRNLQFCTLEFNETSSYKRQGLTSILNGLRSCKQLINLQLHFETTGDIGDDTESDSLPISDICQNMNYLEDLKLDIMIEESIKSLQKINLYSSLLTSSSSSLQFVNLKTNEKNPLNQDMLDDLALSLDNLNNLSKLKISAFIVNNKTIKIPYACARLCNKNPMKTLLIKSKEGKLMLTFNHSIIIKLKANSFKNLEMDFLGELDENAVIKCHFLKNNILSNIKKLNAKIVIILIDKIENEEDLDAFCNIVSLMQKNEELSMEISTQDRLIAKSFEQITNYLTKLVNLKVLNINLFANNIYESQQLRLQMIQKLRILQQLTTFSVFTDQTFAKSKLIPHVQRHMKRVVQVSHSFHLFNAFTIYIP